MLLFCLTGTQALYAQAAAGPAAQTTNEEDFVISDQTGNPAQAQAQAGSQQNQTQLQFTGVTIWDFVRMILVLAGVVGAIYALFYFLKKSANPRKAGGDLIRILDYKPLVGSKAVHLVELGTHVYLVGSGDSAVSLLAEVSDKETLDKIRLTIAERPPLQAAPKFVQVLNRLLGAKETPTLAAHDTFNFMKKQKDRLKKLQ